MTQSEYKDFLQLYKRTDYWKGFRLTVLNERGWYCEFCGISNDKAKREWGQALNIHHCIYRASRLFHEEPEDVDILCYGCHVKEHERLEQAKLFPEIHPDVAEMEYADQLYFARQSA